LDACEILVSSWNAASSEFRPARHEIRLRPTNEPGLRIPVAGALLALRLCAVTHPSRVNAPQPGLIQHPPIPARAAALRN
jgi:hypothetical protein